MANWRGHVCGGVALGAGYVALLSYTPVTRYAEEAHLLHHDWEALIAVIVLSVLFGLFPDIDTNSKGQNIFYGIALVSDIFLLASGNIQASAYLGLIALLPIVGKHRGWTHSKPAMILVPLPIIIAPYLYSGHLWPISIIYYGAAVVGYFSHLLLDGLIFKHFRIKGF